MNRIVLAVVLMSMAGLANAVPEKVTPEMAEEKGCLSCHEGIEDFTEGRMWDDILEQGASHNDENGCVICHGGNPLGTTMAEAHKGSPASLVEKGGPKLFLPDPGAVGVNETSCGQCHSGYGDRLEKSLMNTEAGKLQGNLWSWGLQDNMQTVYGNYTLKDSDGIVPAVGTKAYKKYMKAYASAHPDQMPTEIKQIPQVSPDEVMQHPNKAGITYSRQQCQRCHVGVSGREKRGDYRGAGCSSCHVPYSNEGLYEGGDPTIDKGQRGRPLVHRLQGASKSPVHVNGHTYTGIPHETCASCHNRGKRIGVSYQGIMEFPYGSPYNEQGGKQNKLHTKKYLFIKDDLHHQIESREGNPEGGLLCQDCHTSIDMHGDGNIAGTTLAQVEIECSDCHGSPNQYPWDLPLGFGEEFQTDIDKAARGTTKKVPVFMKKGELIKLKKGEEYLITARGNPFGNVIKTAEDKVFVTSASGLKFEVPVLQNIHKEKSYKTKDGQVAMWDIAQHMESMECYACHADWVPQCYGCHVTVDYSAGKDGKPKSDVDWIDNANSRGPDGMTADGALGTNGIKSPGKVSETRSYLRWETPILGVNGEGRVSPLMPGCQVITTIIGKDGSVLAKNEIWHTPEGKGIDHAAAQPHTAGRLARKCESCHDNPKTLGYGIEDGRFMQGYEKDLIVDLTDAMGNVIPGKATVQSPAIPKLDHDLSQIVTREGKQLVSVGSHWPLTGPLPQEMREKMERTGVCMGCHQKQSDENFWKKVSEQGWLSNDAHQELMEKALKAYEANKK
ncbi:MAG: hypothetical protein ABW092_19570 [Candidatus Thiodiazotropha sp.]